MTQTNRMKSQEVAMHIAPNTIAHKNAELFKLRNEMECGCGCGFSPNAILNRIIECV